MTGRFQDEYEWAMKPENDDKPQARNMRRLAQLYARHADRPTLGLIEGCAGEIRRLYLGKP